MNFIEILKRLNKKSKLLILLFCLIILIIVLPIIWYNSALSPKIKGSSISFEIPLGSGTNKVASILKNNNIVKSEIAFKIYCKLNNVSGLQAGSYTIEKDMSLDEILKNLKTGKVLDKNQLPITFLEGKTMRYIAKTIAENTTNTEEDVFSLLKNKDYLNELIQNYWFISNDILNENIYYPLEGYLFPDTYMFKNKDVTVKEIFKSMLDEMDAVISKYKSDIEKSPYSIHDLLSLASMVEMEGISNNDRASIASAFYNRLDNGMSLGSDVTTYYACRVDVGERDLYAKEINTYNPYNTRGPNMSGRLPVGPISTISEASLKATFEPDDTDYLYFVADKNGNVYFTKTISEHNSKIKELKTNGLWLDFEE